MKNFYDEILEKCEKQEKTEAIYAIEDICERQLLADKLKDFNISFDDIKNTTFIRITEWRGEKCIAMFGPSYPNRKILNSNIQPTEDEMLFYICFSTGAYVFGDDYDKELFNRFFEELKTYEPKYIDEVNHYVYYDLKNGVKVFKDYDKIFKKYTEEHEKRYKRNKYEQLKKEIQKLEEQLKEYEE